MAAKYWFMCGEFNTRTAPDTSESFVVLRTRTADRKGLIMLGGVLLKLLRLLVALIEAKFCLVVGVIGP